MSWVIGTSEEVEAELAAVEVALGIPYDPPARGSLCAAPPFGRVEKYATADVLLDGRHAAKVLEDAEPHIAPQHLVPELFAKFRHEDWFWEHHEGDVGLYLSADFYEYDNATDELLVWRDVGPDGTSGVTEEGSRPLSVVGVGPTSNKSSFLFDGTQRVSFDGVSLGAPCTMWFVFQSSNSEDPQCLMSAAEDEGSAVFAVLRRGSNHADGDAIVLQSNSSQTPGDVGPSAGPGIDWLVLVLSFSGTHVTGYLNGTVLSYLDGESFAFPALDFERYTVGQQVDGDGNASNGWDGYISHHGIIHSELDATQVAALTAELANISGITL